MRPDAPLSAKLLNFASIYLQAPYTRMATSIPNLMTLSAQTIMKILLFHSYLPCRLYKRLTALTQPEFMVLIRALYAALLRGAEGVRDQGKLITEVLGGLAGDDAYVSLQHHGTHVLI